MAANSPGSNLSGRVHALRTPASTDAGYRARVRSRAVDGLGRRQAAAVRARA